MQSILEKILNYHRISSHSPYQFAPGPGFMDWETQPYPFREHKGSEECLLDPHLLGQPTPLSNLFSNNGVPPEELSLKTISLFLKFSLALSAWKKMGESRWALRVNPSSGNLHPLESYLILPPFNGEKKGFLSHYHPLNHSLEKLYEIPDLKFSQSDGFFIFLTSIYWREAWKYGIRAFRYCQLDLGHALGALFLSAHLRGWECTPVWQISIENIQTSLNLPFKGLPPEEEELGEIALWVNTKPQLKKGENPPQLDFIQLGQLVGEMAGIPNQLSPDHESYPDIREIYHLTRGVPFQTIEKVPFHSGTDLKFKNGGDKDCQSAILNRRSAVDMNPDYLMPKTVFEDILTFAGFFETNPIWKYWDLIPNLLPVLFINRVEGYPPGTYLLPFPSNQGVELFETDPNFIPKEGVLPPLIRVKAGNFSDLAMASSCQQEIARNGSFALSILGNLKKCESQPVEYRQLYREAGLLGQLFYLGASAMGVSATGIGCYFDTMVPKFFGFLKEPWTPVYHFTVGEAVDDPRLTTEPPYPHLEP